MAASRATVVAGDVDRGFAFGFISDVEAAHEEHLRSTMILSPFLWIATSRALTALHCAVVQHDGLAVTLRGRPGAGKTTLAYAALRQGFSLLCEDVAFAWKSGSGIELRGMPWHLYLKPDAVRFFPELGELEPLDRYNGESKILVDVRERFPGQGIQHCEPGPTVFVERSPVGRNRLEELSHEEALRRYDETRIPIERRVADGLDIYETLLSQPAYRFDVGPDPLAAAEALRVFCAG
jgi:hypothetical protein